MKRFQDTLYGMTLGDRISSGDADTYGFNWTITRVPGGWIYTTEQRHDHSVFVPFSTEYDGGF